MKRGTDAMAQNADDIIQLLQKIIEDKDKTIEDNRATIDDLKKTIEQLNASIANLTETIDELKRKLFGRSKEKMSVPDLDEENIHPKAEGAVTIVKEHTRERKKKSVRADLYESLPVKEVICDVPDDKRVCPDCDTPMEHMGYTFIREELHIIPAKVIRVKYMQEKLVCPVCREEYDTTIIAAKTPAPLMKHSLASPDMVAEVMYQKVFMDLPFYRQEKYWKQLGVPLPRETQANWFNTCALEYLQPVYDVLHRELLKREVIHADEVPCQVLHEEGKEATSKSYIWLYLSGSDGKPKIILYDYKPGRNGSYPVEFLKGFKGMLHCDGYQGYNHVEDAVLVCCLAHCRRKFFEAVPAGRRKKLKLLDVNSDEIVSEQPDNIADESGMLPAEKGGFFLQQAVFPGTSVQGSTSR